LNYLLFIIIIFVASFSKALSGFSFALVTMSFLPNLFDLKIIVPLISLLQVITTITMVLYYRQSLKVHLILKLILASIIGIPIGILLLKYLNTVLMLKILGAAIIIYSIYYLVVPEFPKIKGEAWPYFFGFLSGLLSGAYNLSAPPIVIYANLSDWKPEEFKINLISTFFVTELITLINRFSSESFYPEVWQLFLIAIIPLGLGLFCGLFFSKDLNLVNFKKIVLILLIFSGLNLIFKS